MRNQEEKRNAIFEISSDGVRGGDAAVCGVRSTVGFRRAECASYSAAVAPGCWVAIFGVNLAASEQNASGALDTMLGGVSVSVAGLTAPLLYVSPGQINALIPPEVAIPPNTVVSLIVLAPAGQSKPYLLRLSREAPGLFTRNGAGTGRAFVFDANFKDAEAVGPNDVVILYATGLGPVDTSGKATRWRSI